MHELPRCQRHDHQPFSILFGALRVIISSPVQVSWQVRGCCVVTAMKDESCQTKFDAVWNSQPVQRWRDVVVLPTVIHQPRGYLEHWLQSIDESTRCTSEVGTLVVHTCQHKRQKNDHLSALLTDRDDWKCGSGKCDTVKIARVENAGVSRMERQREREIILRKPKVTSLYLSLLFWLNKVCLLLH